MWQCDSVFPSSVSQNTSVFSSTLGCCNDAPWPSKSLHNMLSSRHILFLQQALCTHYSCSYLRAEENDRVTVSSQWFSVGVLQQRWPVCVRARKLSAVWAGSVHWLKSVSYTLGWHRPVSRLLFLWIPSWPTCDSPESNMMDHLLHLSSCTEKDGCHWLSNDQQSSSMYCNNAIILCKNIWLYKNSTYNLNFEIPPGQSLTTSLVLTCNCIRLLWDSCE